MSPATALFTYLWHYLVARLLYDELLRPLVHGRLLALVALAAIVALALLVGRSLSRTRSRRRR
jgi:peptidoglycan/LPS O-acetylase OafA/YrhL